MLKFGDVWYSSQETAGISWLDDIVWSAKMFMIN